MGQEPTERSQKLPFDFESFFRNASLPVQILQGDRLIYANPATLEELGYTSLDEFPMENPAAISPERQPDGELSHLKARRMLSLAASEGIARFDWVHVRRDGERFVSEVLLTPVHSNGESYIFASWTDLTERIELEQKRRTLEKRLEAATKTQAIAELSGGLAHDLNNFLQVIAGYAQLGQQGATTEANEYLDRVIESTASARKLVRRMLSLGTVEESSREDICLNEFLQELVPLLRMLVVPGQTLVVDVPTDVTHARAGRVGLERAIMNLVSNASDAADDNGEITVSLSRAPVTEDFLATHAWANPGEYAVIAVEDNGIGMDDRTAGRIFEPFFSHKRRGGGTGLGLSNVLSTLSGFGGGLQVDSEPGRGTRIECFLALSESANEAAFLPDVAATSCDALEKAGCSCVAIVFDRNEQVRELTRIALTEENCQVVMPDSEADIRSVFAARSHLIGAIVLDADELFDIEGLISYLRQNSRSPIIITATRVSPVLDELSKSVPGCRFLLKPYDLDYFRRSLEELDMELQPDNLSGL